MKIGFLTNNLNYKTGGGRYAVEITEGVKSRGIEVVVLTEKNNLKDGGHQILGRGFKIFSSAINAISLLKDCDIIHALDGYPYGIIAALANIRLKKKLIFSAQGTYAIAPLYNWKTRDMMKWAYRKADKILAISRYTKKQILSEININTIEVVSPGVDLSKFKIERKVDNGDSFMLSVGGLKERKGYETTIKSFAMVSPNYPSLKYIIVGEREDWYYRKLLRLTKSYGVSNKVIFLENISDEELKKLYSRAKFFILTPINEDYHFEGFGLVYLEAAAAGLPVIGTFGNGAEDAINNKGNGFLVNQRNIEETAKIIKKLLDDDILLEKMSQESYRWAKDNSTEKVMDKYINIYNNL